MSLAQLSSSSWYLSHFSFLFSVARIRHFSNRHNIAFLNTGCLAALVCEGRFVWSSRADVLHSPFSVPLHEHQKSQNLKTNAAINTPPSRTNKYNKPHNCYNMTYYDHYKTYETLFYFMVHPQHKKTTTKSFCPPFSRPWRQFPSPFFISQASFFQSRHGVELSVFEPYWSSGLE